MYIEYLSHVRPVGTRDIIVHKRDKNPCPHGAYNMEIKIKKIDVGKKGKIIIVSG